MNERVPDLNEVEQTVTGLWYCVSSHVILPACCIW